MSKSVTAHSPAIAVGTPPRNLRSLVAVLLVALASLGATIGYIAIDDSGTTTTTTTVANGQSAPLDDPFQARTQPAPSQSGPSESAIAASISQAQVEQPRPVGGPDESAVASAISPQPSVTGPDESAIAAAIGNHGDTGSQARFQAYQDKLDSMSAQQKADAFAR
jgi:hypothetical protein